MMKKNQLIINLGLAMTILFSILFQSIHSYEHLAKQFSEKICNHTKNWDSEITHQHHNYDHCFVCECTSGSYISPNYFCYQLQSQYTQTFRSLIQNENPISFSGSLYSLRGPPICIV